MSHTDFLGINGHKLFKQLSKSIGTTCNKTMNIIAERHNVLYAWNSDDSCVLTLNIKAAREKEESVLNYQTLLPHSPPYFNPERLILNETNTILIAAGPNGILVFELPERTPPCGNFGNNKEVIYCRTYSLLENIISFSSTVECRQVRFHPGSPIDSHFLVLTSDNVIRLFSVRNSSISEIATYSLGPKPVSRIPNRNLSFLDVLGDLAVDFDFTSPIFDTSNDPKPGPSYRNISNSRGDYKSKDEDELIWPIFILYGNGLICKMMIDYNGEKCHPGLYGPLNFQNFPSGNLADFCSILCVPTAPPILVIAHCGGNLYHGLELPNDDEEIQEHTSNESKQAYCKSANTELHLLEVIQVELGLTTSISNVDSINYNCPIFLKRDLGSLGSYYATHNTGVHSIHISAADELHQFVSKEDDVPTEGMFTNPSTAEYLICTKMAPKENLNPVLGIAIVNEPHAVITFLANGNVTTLSVKDHFRSVSSNAADSTEDDKDGGENLNLSSSLISSTAPFDVYINNILKKSTTQPILQADTKNSEPSEEVCYEVYQRASKIFREEHFVNLRKAREEIEKRAKQLQLLQEFQTTELNNMQKERQILQSNAENIAEKYEDLQENQEEISKRCQMMLIMLSRKQTAPSIAEEKYFEQLQVYDKKMDGFIVAIEKLKDKMKYQQNQMINWKRENQRPDQLLPGQNETIKKHLSDTTKKIAEITSEVKDYMNKLNIR